MKRLAIIGSGDLGQLIAYHAYYDNHYEIAGFFDDFREMNSNVNGHKILGNTNDIQKAFLSKDFDYLMIGIGYKHFKERKKLFDKHLEKIPFGKIIHSSSYIDSSCKVGEGVAILPGCVLDHNVIVDHNVFINTGCVTAHDSKINSHTFLSPSVSIAGFVGIGSSCNIGIGTTVIDNISIINEVQTGGGTVVIKDIQKQGLYVGNPARFIR